MTNAPEAFEAWWQALPLRDGKITADHIRQAWDAGVLLEREACAQEAETMAKQNCAGFRNAADEDFTTRMIVNELSALAEVIRTRI
jgi:hypothetical protein